MRSCERALSRTFPNIAVAWSAVEKRQADHVHPLHRDFFVRQHARPRHSRAETEVALANVK